VVKVKMISQDLYFKFGSESWWGLGVPPHRHTGNMYLVQRTPTPKERHEENFTLHLKPTCLQLQASFMEGQGINPEVPEYNLTELQLFPDNIYRDTKPTSTFTVWGPR
jgi:hypothetical protein